MIREVLDLLGEVTLPPWLKAWLLGMALVMLALDRLAAAANKVGFSFKTDASTILSLNEQIARLTSMVGIERQRAEHESRSRAAADEELLKLRCQLHELGERYIALCEQTGRVTDTHLRALPPAVERDEQA